MDNNAQDMLYPQTGSGSAGDGEDNRRYPAWSFGPGSEKDYNLQERAWAKQKVQMLRSHQQQLRDIISHGNEKPPTIKTKEDPIPAIRAMP